MRNDVRDLLFKVGQASTALLPLRDLKVPPPDQAIIGYPTTIIRGDATRVQDGYLQLQWVWDVLGRESLKILMGAMGVQDGDTYKSVYVSTDARDSTQAIPVFVTYSCILYVPTLTGSDGVSVARSPYAYQSLKLIFNKLVEVV